MDVVLNSLSGDFIPVSLRALAGDGRFVEIGKRDIWSAARVAQARPDAQYTVLYLGGQYEDAPERLAGRLRGVVEAVHEGRLEPLPHRVFGLEEAIDGFRYMAQARHIGKVVLNDQSASRSVRLVDAILPNATYVITGGLGGIGRHLATWLAAHGARHLLLIGRTGAATPEALDTVAALRAGGTHVEIARADVAYLDRLLRGAAPGGDDAAAHPRRLPLRGHRRRRGAAGAERRALQAGPGRKADSAWNLHLLTQHLPLDLFVVFSSIAATLGSAGQASYAAANAYLDGLAQLRRAEGLPGLSIGWGAWQATGMSAALSETDTRRLTRRGIIGMPPQQALELMGGLNLFGPANVSIAHLATPRPSVPEQAEAHVSDVRRPDSLLERWRQTPAGQRRGVLAAHIHSEVVRVLGLPATQAIAPRQPFNELGLDSLGAVELRNALAASLERAARDAAVRSTDERHADRLPAGACSSTAR